MNDGGVQLIETLSQCLYTYFSITINEKFRLQYKPPILEVHHFKAPFHDRALQHIIHQKDVLVVKTRHFNEKWRKALLTLHNYDNLTQSGLFDQGEA